LDEFFEILTISEVDIKDGYRICSRLEDIDNDMFLRNENKIEQKIFKSLENLSKSFKRKIYLQKRAMINHDLL
jgi:CRISPR/Cas system type I-B associated protein Csh2 (Cas7 group RAMP superfamily)